MTRHREAGMTLIEILIAMSIMAILSVLGYKAFSNLLIARESLMATSQRWVDLARGFRRVETDIARLPTAAAQEDARRDGQRGLPLRLDSGGSAGHLELQVFSGMTPEGRETIRYQAGDGLTWQAQKQGVSKLASPWRVFPAGYQVSWRVMGADGSFTEVWPREGESSALPRALEMHVVMPDGTGVTRLWNLP